MLGQCIWPRGKVRSPVELPLVTLEGEGERIHPFFSSPTTRPLRGRVHAFMTLHDPTHFSLINHPSHASFDQSTTISSHSPMIHFVLISHSCHSCCIIFHSTTPHLFCCWSSRFPHVHPNYPPSVLHFFFALLYFDPRDAGLYFGGVFGSTSPPTPPPHLPSLFLPRSCRSLNAPKWRSESSFLFEAVILISFPCNPPWFAGFNQFLFMISIPRIALDFHQGRWLVISFSPCPPSSVFKPCFLTPLISIIMHHVSLCTTPRPPIPVLWSLPRPVDPRTDA